MSSRRDNACIAFDYTIYEGEKKKEDKIEKKRVEKKEEAVDESLIDQVDQVRTDLNELQNVIGNQIPEQENQLFEKIFDILNLIEEFEAGKQ
ncbi:unnamed protein product [Rhizophagus irregularis]|nr:unnamed protein product [Rhizophagus irregularis]